MKQILIMSVLFISSITVAQNGNDFVAPEVKTAEMPAAIPADHQAIIESEKVINRINSDAYFKLQQQVKQAKLNELVALANKGTAEASASACKANQKFCKDAGISIAVDTTQTEAEKEKIRIEEEIEEKKRATLRKAKQQYSNDRARLNQVRINSVSQNEAMLNIDGSQVVLSSGETWNDIKLVSINADSSITIKAIRSGQSRKVSGSTTANYPTGNIQPLVLADEDEGEESSNSNNLLFPVKQ